MTGPCTRWAAAAGQHCGGTPTRLYIQGHRCNSHTPAALAGEPEPGQDAHCAPNRRYCQPEDQCTTCAAHSANKGRGGRMTKHALPLMAKLARHRTQARIPQTAIAAHLGVDRVTVYRWEAGERSPHYLHAIGYAHHMGQTIILRDGMLILVEGVDIPAAIPQLRATAGLTPRQFAHRLHIIPPAVHAAERRGYQLLSSYETAARGLGYTIDLARHNPAVSHA